MGRGISGREVKRKGREGGEVIEVIDKLGMLGDRREEEVRVRRTLTIHAGDTAVVEL